MHLTDLKMAMDVFMILSYYQMGRSILSRLDARKAKSSELAASGRNLSLDMTGWSKHPTAG